MVDCEWIVTNGIGGYASGTIVGVVTRRYHGVLVAALNPPLGRTVLVAKVDESVSVGGDPVPLFANQWNTASSPIEPNGFLHLVRFRLDGTMPVWSYEINGALLEKSIWMAPGSDTTYVRYEYRSGPRPLHLEAKVMANYRDFHQTTHADDWRMAIEPVIGGVRVDAFEGAAPFYLLSDRATIEPRHDWYRNYFLRVEAFRGLDALDDNLYAAHAALDLRERYEAALFEKAGVVGDERLSRLTLAADRFVVRRSVVHARKRADPRVRMGVR